MLNVQQCLLDDALRKAETLVSISLLCKGREDQMLSLWAGLWRYTLLRAKKEIKYLRKSMIIQRRLIVEQHDLHPKTRLFYVLDPKTIRTIITSPKKVMKKKAYIESSAYAASVVAKWNELAAKFSLQKVMTVGNSRKTKIYARTKDYKGVYNQTELWTKFCEGVSQCVQQHPKLKRCKWFTFDYAVRNEMTFDKVMSGRVETYEENQKKQEEQATGFKVFHGRKS